MVPIHQPVLGRLAWPEDIVVDQENYSHDKFHVQLSLNLETVI